MAKINPKGVKISGMDSIKYYTPQPSMKKKTPMKATKKMSPDMVAKRKRSMISNAASKTLGGLYSK